MFKQHRQQPRGKIVLAPVNLHSAYPRPEGVGEGRGATAALPGFFAAGDNMPDCRAAASPARRPSAAVYLAECGFALPRALPCSSGRGGKESQGRTRGKLTKKQNHLATISTGARGQTAPRSALNLAPAAGLE